ncbi:hypothetical protein REPUB_Repub12eG0038400 [Reevesia pubescens]
MASFKCFSATMAIIFLAASFFSFNGCHAADHALIDSICKQSQDYDFCMGTLGNDPRIDAANLNGLALISISLTISQLQDTLDRIPGILSQLKDPIAHERLEVCQNDYSASLESFRGSYKTTSENAYFDTINFVRDGTNKVIDCHNIYRRNEPIATSPIAGDDIKVIKFSEIILLINDRLIPKK